MSDGKPSSPRPPLHTWLPRVLLTFLVFLTLVYVIYQVTGGMGERELGDRGMWVLIVAMALLVLLPVVDRLQALSLSATGLEAKLSETKAQALEKVGALVEDPETVETARAEIMQAKSAEQVRDAVDKAVELNVMRTLDLVKEAILEKHKCYVRYRPIPDEPVQTYHMAPLDIKPGATPATRVRDYLWGYSYEHESVVSLRMDRVLGVELSEETFDPAELSSDWKSRAKWNVKRSW